MYLFIHPKDGLIDPYPHTHPPHGCFSLEGSVWNGTGMQEGEDWGKPWSEMEVLERQRQRRLLGAREPVTLGTVALFWLPSSGIHDVILHCVQPKGVGIEECVRVCIVGGKTWQDPHPQNLGIWEETVHIKGDS